jgi:uncharacterized repeat protein (TIGR02543 family)
VKMNNHYGPQPTNNGSDTVYLSTLTVGNPAQANKAITSGSINGVACAETPDAAVGVYGVKDGKTDADGKLYFWLPAAENSEPVKAEVDEGLFYANSFARAANNSTTAMLLQPEATPNASIDYANAKLTGLTASAEYLFGSAAGNADGEGKYAIDEAWFNTTLSIVKKGNGTTGSNSEAQPLPIPARPNTPNVGKTDETVAGLNNGAITGLTTAMEYKLLTASSWTDCAGTTVTGLAPGTYQVRTKAVASGVPAFASAAATVAISNGAAPTRVLNVTPPTFGAETYGYTTLPDAKAIKIGNSGNSEATITEVKVSDFKKDNAPTNIADLFTIGGSGATVAPKSSIETWTVRPNAGLNAGTYTATITATYDASATATATVTFTVAKKSLGHNVTPTNKVYDGTNVAHATGGLTVGDIEAGDDVTLDSAFIFSTGKDTVTGGTVTATTWKLSGADSGSYELATFGTHTADITKKNITITAFIAPKIYDGTDSAQVDSVRFVGLVAGETLTLGAGYTVDSAFFDSDSAGVGNRTVTVYVSLVTNDETAKNYELENRICTLRNQTISHRSISIDTAFIAPKIYDGNDSATVDSVRFAGLVAGETLTLGAGYTVDSAFFDSDSAGEGRTVTVYVSLAANETAKNYVLQTGTRTLRNQTILRSPQKILFPDTDTAISVKDGSYTLSATDSTGGALPLPVRFRLTPADAVYAKLSGDTLMPLQPGTVYVTAYIEPNPNYEDADTVRRKFIIITTSTSRDSCEVTFNTSDGGSRVDAQLVAAGNTVARPANPTKNGYKFAGWYANADFTAPWDFSTNTVTADTTLHAKWEKLFTDSLKINGELLRVSQQALDAGTIEYTIPCGDGRNTVEVVYSVDAYDSDTLRIDATRPFRCDTAVTFGSGNRYVLTLVKQLEFDSIAHAQLGGRLLMVINNPKYNGGFVFKEASWRKSGEDYWSGPNGKFYYVFPSGELITDTIYLRLRDTAGTLYECCPYCPPALPEASAEAHMAVYPNPVRSGAVVHLKEEFLTDLTDLTAESQEYRYTTLYLIDVQGTVVYAGKASELSQGLTMPTTPGAYYLVLEGKAGRKVFKITAI